MTVTAIDVHNPENRIDDARILAVYWRDDPKPSYHAVPVTDADRYVRMWEQHAETVTYIGDNAIPLIPWIGIRLTIPASHGVAAWGRATVTVTP